MRSIAIAITCLLAVSSAFASTIHVPADHPTIQAGINAAVNGDTVLVAPGTYHESVTISDKSNLQLVGQTGAQIVAGASDGIDLTRVTGTAVMGFELKGCNRGIFLVDCSSLVVTHCNAHDNAPGPGFCAYSGSNIVFENNISARNAYIGIMSMSAVGTRIQNNTIVSNAVDGVLFLYAVQGCAVYNNLIASNGDHGLEFWLPPVADSINFNDTWSNARDYYGCVPGGGGISTDPRFVDAASFDYRLSGSSPCIDAGNSLPVFNDSNGTRNDIGALPFLSPYVARVNLGSEKLTQVMNRAPTFFWSYFDVQSAQTAYEIEVGSDLDWTVAELWRPGPIYSSDTSSVYSGAPLIEGLTYYLRLRVYGGIKLSTWVTLAFHLDGPPTAPILKSPLDGRSVTNKAAVLVVHNSSDPEGDSLKYDFEVYRDENLTTLLVNQSGISQQRDTTCSDALDPLSSNTLYWWRARAFDGAAYSEWSLPTSFLAHAAAAIHVPSSYTTIQAGIDAALYGDTVLVAPGTYTGAIVINDRDLTILSSGGCDSTLWNWSPATSFGMQVANTPDGLFQGFTIASSSRTDGIKVSSANFTFRGNRFQDLLTTSVLISGDGTGICRIEKNSFNRIDASNAMLIFTGSEVVSAINNTIDSTLRGIAAYVAGSTVQNNIFRRCADWAVWDDNRRIEESYNCYWQNGTNYLSRPNDPTNLYTDPRFAILGQCHFALARYSPCIDAGNPAPAFNDSDGTRSDIGAVYFEQSPKASNIRFLAENSTHVVSLSPTLVWHYFSLNGSQAALSIKVGTDTSFSTGLLWSVDSLPYHDTLIQYAGLLLTKGLDYYLTMQLRDDTRWGPWYNTKFHTNSVPTVPILVSPEIGSVVRTAPTLTIGNSTDAEGDVIRYDFQVFSDSGLTTLEVSEPKSSSPNWSPGSMGENMRHWWRARAWDGFEYSGWAPVSDFWIDATEEPPSAPAQLIPSSDGGGPVFTLLPNLSWHASTDPDLYDTVRYKVELSMTPNFTFTMWKDSLLFPEFQVVDSLRFGTQYWWRISAKDKTGLTTMCQSPANFWTWQLGDLNGSHVCDLADLSALVSYLTGGGYVISPKLVGDLNGTCFVDLADLSVMVNYLTGGGAQLKPGCERLGPSAVASGHVGTGKI
jgi:hypothetical protein